MVACRRACSRSGLLAPEFCADAATRTAVTLVMKDSMGSTVSLVTAMMNASHVAFSSFSSSFLLSTCVIAANASVRTQSI